MERISHNFLICSEYSIKLSQMGPSLDQFLLILDNFEQLVLEVSLLGTQFFLHQRSAHEIVIPFFIMGDLHYPTQLLGKD